MVHAAVVSADRIDLGNHPELYFGGWLRRGDDDRLLRRMPSNQLLGRPDVDDPSSIDDGDAIAQSLRLFHQVRRQEHGLAARADTAHQFPDRSTGLRIESRRQLIEKDQLRVVDERKCDEQPLLLPARQRHEPGIALVAQAELLEQAVAINRLLI